MNRTNKSVTRLLRLLGYPLIIMGLLTLAACTGGETTSQACQSAFDSNGNPTTNCVGGN
jgi:hypothetical protein